MKSEFKIMIREMAKSRFISKAVATLHQMGRENCNEENIFTDPDYTPIFALFIDEVSNELSINDNHEESEEIRSFVIEILNELKAAIVVDSKPVKTDDGL